MQYDGLSHTLATIPVNTMGSSNQKPLTTFLSYVKHFALLIRKETKEENMKALEPEAAGSTTCRMCELAQRVQVSRALVSHLQVLSVNQNGRTHL